MLREDIWLRAPSINVLPVMALAEGTNSKRCKALAGSDSVPTLPSRMAAINDRMKQDDNLNPRRLVPRPERTPGVTDNTLHPIFSLQ